tara:strand:+ start:12657 stop:12884 length:228 start_codon:yes stop_codon:yes gene_type:complete
MPKHISCRYFKTSPEIIQLAVMLYVRFSGVVGVSVCQSVIVAYINISHFFKRGKQINGACGNIFALVEILCFVLP